MSTLILSGIIVVFIIVIFVVWRLYGAAAQAIDEVKQDPTGLGKVLNLPKIYTDCAKYGNSSVPNTCPAGRELWGGACYTKCPEGYKRTASCTCEKGQIETNCSKYGAQEAPKDSCPEGYEWYGGLCYKKCPSGSTRTAACTCDFGPLSTVWTDCNLFYNKPCPEGWSKTAICTCQKGGIVTDCDRFGGAIMPDKTCPSGTEYYGGLCYKKCPEGSVRTAACTCSSLDIRTDCNLYGNGAFVGSANGPQCGAGQELWGGLCYSGKCPTGTSRTASCTCTEIKK